MLRTFGKLRGGGSRFQRQERLTWGQFTSLNYPLGAQAVLLRELMKRISLLPGSKGAVWTYCRGAIRHRRHTKSKARSMVPANSHSERT